MVSKVKDTALAENNLNSSEFSVGLINGCIFKKEGINLKDLEKIDETKTIETEKIRFACIVIYRKKVAQ